MNQAQLPYVALYLLSTFLASVSQVLLKKAALREHKSLLAEYTDWRVVLGYGLFVGCSLLTMLAYKGVPLNASPNGCNYFLSLPLTEEAAYKDK